MDEELPIRTVDALTPGQGEPHVLLAPRRDAAGATVEIDVDGHAARVWLADLIDAVAGAAADTGVQVPA